MKRTKTGKGTGNAFISYKVFKTAIGWCGVIITERQIVRLFIGYTKLNKLIKHIMNEFGNKISLTPPSRTAVEKIVRYCCGEKVSFAGLPMDWSSLTAFQQKVFRAAMQIPYGKVETYGSLAQKIGVPKGSRAVGNALAKNPFPLLVPCHRIVRGDGKMGGFSAIGGIKLKKRLLSMEKAKKKRP